MGKRVYGTIIGAMVFCLSLFYGCPVEAHNGKVALGFPVEGIVVDGDLSDWPEEMRRYPILLPEYGVWRARRPVETLRMFVFAGKSSSEGRRSLYE